MSLLMLGVHLLPNDYRDFKVACDCPDYEVPCKHIAGVCYRLAGQLDQDPFLLFEMRGLAPEKLLQELASSPLGKVLSDAKSSATVELAPVASFYTRPSTHRASTGNQPERFLAWAAAFTQRA